MDMQPSLGACHCIPAQVVAASSARDAQLRQQIVVRILNDGWRA